MDDIKKPGWSIAEAKARLGEVIELAQSGQPQRITANAAGAVVVVSAAEWEKATKPKQTLYECLRTSPLVGMDFNLERDKSGPRDIEL